jgi:hypothetical protein
MIRIDKGRCHYSSAAKYLQTGRHFLALSQASFKDGMRKQNKIMERT